MALQQLANKLGLRIAPFRSEQETNQANANNIINAAGESVALIGRVFLEGGSGSKTISSSGGVIYLTLNTITWANAATNLRVGIQDVVTTTGIEDTTYDVHADLVPGTDTLTGAAVNAIAMDSGTKTISHGDIVAVVTEMTARGGTDSIDIHAGAISDNNLFPYKTQDTGSGPAKNITDVPGVMLKFDDATFGWIHGLTTGFGTSISYAANSTPDEYALVFQIPFAASLSACSVILGAVASGDDFEIVLYSDPLGTPVAEQTIAVDPDIVGSTSGMYYTFFTPYTLSANTNYAVAVRPTTNNSIALSYLEFGAGNGNLRKSTPLGTNWSIASRTNQTGAFTQTANQLPAIALFLDQFHDGTGGSSGPAHFI